MNNKHKWLLFTGLLSIGSGLFLIIDSFYIHAITYDYARLGISWLDQFLQHWMVGLIVVVFGLINLKFAFKKR